MLSRGGRGLDAALMFDRDPARRPPYRRLFGEAWSLLTYRPAPPRPETLPPGRGRAVLVIPAFLTADLITRDLRAFLSRCGYRVFGWGLGLNWGPTERILERLDRRVGALHAAHGPLALVGVSLGGVLARNLAYERAGDISHVVSIASPFRLPTARTIAPLVRLCAWNYSAGLRPARLLTPLPVPSTMIYSREDGIVAPESCWAAEPAGEVVALAGAHLMLSHNPDALRAIARRLGEG